MYALLAENTCTDLRCKSEIFICGLAAVKLCVQFFNLAPRLCPYDSDHRCGDGYCIRSTGVCDTYLDCNDGSDEVNCSKHSVLCTDSLSNK